VVASYTACCNLFCTHDVLSASTSVKKQKYCRLEVFYVWRLLYIFCRCVNDVDHININSTSGTGMSDIVIIVNSISVLVQRFNSV